MPCPLPHPPLLAYLIIMKHKCLSTTTEAACKSHFCCVFLNAFLIIFFFHSIGPIFPRRPLWHGNYRLSKLRSSTLPNIYIYNFGLLLSSHDMLQQRPRRKLKSSLFHTGDQKHMGPVLLREKNHNAVELLAYVFMP